MSRYFVKSALVITPSEHDSGRHMDVYDESRSMTVHEDDLETFTGLLDARGAEIHRSERIPLGFRFPK